MAASPAQREVKLTKKQKRARKKLKKHLRHLKELLDNQPLEVSSSKKEEIKWQIVPFALVQADFENFSSHEITGKQLAKLSEDILSRPWGLEGGGKPEILKGYSRQFGVTVFSRRLNHEDRLVYVLDPQRKKSSSFLLKDITRRN